MVMEDGLGLSLSLKAFERSPPSVPSLRLASNNNKSFFSSLDRFLKSPPQPQSQADTRLNLGWVNGATTSKPTKHEGLIDDIRAGNRNRALSLDVAAGKRDEVAQISSDGGGGEKKKLRLSKEQFTLLDQTFFHHSTLNNKQKLYLAKQLNLKPRQVEVWFQNRRARTKVKQAEEDCEFLRKYCEELCDENKRLHMQLQELRSPIAVFSHHLHRGTYQQPRCPPSTASSPTLDKKTSMHACLPY